MRWLQGIAALWGLLGLLGATLYAHVRPIPALNQAAFIFLTHAPILLWLSQEKPLSFRYLIIASFLVGGGLFGGSIYLSHLAGLTRATLVAPAGGICLFLGWGLLGLAALIK
ncbi:MAG: hypothetical protein NZ958_01990 [Bacteroidia bacterium]|nr:hypothetical protein [Bacteroidia bacterium]MDW8089114.1 hypothetical protein [Bacteroidia bacterium]